MLGPVFSKNQLHLAKSCSVNIMKGSERRLSKEQIIHSLPAALTHHSRSHSLWSARVVHSSLAGPRWSMSVAQAPRYIILLENDDVSCEE